jgi:hypothetical protein
VGQISATFLLGTSAGSSINSCTAIIAAVAAR